MAEIMGLYDSWRKDGGPTQYGPLKTAATWDVLETGFLYAAAIVTFSLLLTVPGHKQRVFAFTRIIIGVFVLSSIVLVNFGQKWETARVSTRTQYRSGVHQHIRAHIGVNIGLRGINITLKGDPVVQVFKNGQVNETINYNERFYWSNEGFTLGRTGFGPFAGQFNRDFRAAQRKGLPYPILWVAEYLTTNGIGSQWGRQYLQAGYFTHIMIWTALPLWILAMILFYMVIRYGGYFSLLTGVCLLTSNLLWATIRNDNDLKIHFEDGILTFSWGFSFWLCLANGILCILIGVMVVFLEKVYPEALASFFGIDVTKLDERYYINPAELKVVLQSRSSRRYSVFKEPKTTGSDTFAEIDCYARTHNESENKSILDVKQTAETEKVSQGEDGKGSLPKMVQVHGNTCFDNEM